MTTAKAEAVGIERPATATRQRRKREPRELADERLVDEALGCWAEWLRAYILPRPVNPRACPLGTLYETIAEPAFKAARSAGHSDPTLAGLLADERNLRSWPMRVHLMIAGLPKNHRIALVGTQFLYSQQGIAEVVKVSQRHVSTLVTESRLMLLLALRVFEHTRRAHEREAARKSL